jgi:hypothetical protein
LLLEEERLGLIDVNGNVALILQTPPFSQGRLQVVPPTPNDNNVLEVDDSTIAADVVVSTSFAVAIIDFQLPPHVTERINIGVQ